MKKLALLTLIAATTISPFALAKNTNEDWRWKSTYYKDYGLWTTACDEKVGEPDLKRCYLRYVDAYAREPFGAMFVFIFADQGEPRFQFEFERGTNFTADWQVTKDNQGIFAFDPDDCPFFGDCIIENEAALRFADALLEGDALNIDLTDGEDRSFSLSWDAAPFNDAYADLVEQSKARGL